MSKILWITTTKCILYIYIYMPSCQRLLRYYWKDEIIITTAVLIYKVSKRNIIQVTEEIFSTFRSLVRKWKNKLRVPIRCFKLRFYTKKEYILEELQRKQLSKTRFRFSFFIYYIVSKTLTCSEVLNRVACTSNII